MSSLLDASALLAALQGEQGGELVGAALAGGASIGAVNLSEVVAKLADAGMSESAVRSALDPLAINVIDFDADLAYATGLLRIQTRQAGLSLGDRACLALAGRLDIDVLTTDRAWADLGLAVKVQLVR